jgi:hypothetical protein
MIAWTCQLVAACGLFLVRLTGYVPVLSKLGWIVAVHYGREACRAARRYGRATWLPVREFLIGSLALFVRDLVVILRFLLGSPKR